MESKTKSCIARELCSSRGFVPSQQAEDQAMAVNKPAGDNARKGAVKRRSQLVTKTQGQKTWTKRKTKGAGGGRFMAQKKAKKFKGVRREKAS
jgi:hypothetical protein